MVPLVGLEPTVDLLALLRVLQTPSSPGLFSGKSDGFIKETIKTLRPYVLKQLGGYVVHYDIVNLQED